MSPRNILLALLLILCSGSWELSDILQQISLTYQSIAALRASQGLVILGNVVILTVTIAKTVRQLLLAKQAGVRLSISYALLRDGKRLRTLISTTRVINHNFLARYNLLLVSDLRVAIHIADRT